jgi:hypothetical protein
VTNPIGRNLNFSSISIALENAGNIGVILSENPMNIFAFLVFGEFTDTQGETTSSIRIADSLGEARNSGR